MADPNPKETMSVKEIHVFPLKSLRGLSPASHRALYTGFQHDRRFMFQRVATGANMAVAKETEMCLFSTHIPEKNGGDAVGGGGDGVALDDVEEVEVRYNLPHAFNNPSNPVSPDSLVIPLSPSTSNLQEVQVTMHYSPTTAYNMGEKYNTWFSERFGYEVRLLYIGGNKRLVLGNMPPNIAGLQRERGTKGEGRENTYERISNGATGTAGGGGGSGGGGGWLGTFSSTVQGILGSSHENKENENSEKQYEGVDAGISFADVAPYLIITTSSYAEILSRLPPPREPSDPPSSVLDAARFRPNILVSTPDLPPFDEDFWAQLLITNPTTGKRVEIVLTQNCARCNSLNVDYSTGKVAEGERGKVLAKLGKDRRVDGGAKWSGVFGRYGFLKRVEGEEEGEGVRISVGDRVEVLRRNGERTRFEWPNLSTDS